MNQQFNNKFKLNGSVQFLVYDQNNQLIDTFKNHNTVYYTGSKAYKQILGLMDNSVQPTATSVDDDYQVNLQSNPSDFLQKNGKTPFLQPITLKKKKEMNLQCSFRYKYQSVPLIDRDGRQTENISLANNDSNIINKNSFAKNSENTITTIKTKGSYMDGLVKKITNNVQQWIPGKVYFNNGQKWCYIYSVPQDYWFQYIQMQSYVDRDSSSNSSNSSSSLQQDQQIVPILKKQFDGLYHSGLRVDIKGPQYQNFHIQIAYDFEGVLTPQVVNGVKRYNFDFTDIPQPIFPALNGKPTNRQFAGCQGGAITNQSIHTYFYDIYPRYCKFPKNIVFLFDHHSSNHTERDNERAYFDTTDIQIERIQFFKHSLPKCGPLSMYFETNNSQKYMTKINKTTIRDNSICYYASIGYNEAIGLQFNRVGLANAKNNYKFIKDDQVNIAFNNNEQQMLSDTKPKIKGQYFYKLAKVQPNQCKNILTVANTGDWSFKKTQKNRIDVIYKMNIGFGD